MRAAPSDDDVRAGTESAAHQRVRFEPGYTIPTGWLPSVEFDDAIGLPPQTGDELKAIPVIASGRP